MGNPNDDATKGPVTGRTSTACSLAILSIFCLLFLGCGKRITEGDIVEKWHEPERTWVQVVPITISNGKTTTTTYVPMTQVDDEDWIIQIEAVLDDGETKTRNFYVSREVYETVDIGDYYVYDKAMASGRDPVSKRR